MLEKMLHEIVMVNEMQFGLRPEISTIDAVLILNRLQEEYYAKVICVLCGHRECF